MLKKGALFAHSLFVVLITASAYGQTQSEPVGVRYEKEHLPRRSNVKHIQRTTNVSAPMADTQPTADAVPRSSFGKFTTIKSTQPTFLNVQNPTPSWPQWGHDSAHSGTINVVGQSPNQILADIVYDPFVEQEKASGERVFGEADLFVHYQTPLVDGNDVF